MKIDRRSFLALGIGAAAGTAFTPLPWKLTDDLSIWTQNWPWTPVPEDGDAYYDHSVCTLCPGGCGILVRKINDRIVKIEGMPSHPVNRGGICALGISGPQLLYGPDRVIAPMKRSGARGEGKWTTLSWDDAIAEVLDRLKKLEADNKTEHLACICDTDRGTVPQLFKRMLSLFGSPNFMTTPSMYDSYEAVLKKMHGRKDTLDIGFDFENTDFILSFGSGVIEGWGSPVRMIMANSAWKTKKAKQIQIEQRLSNTAASSNGLFAVKPGTEADLALGLACVIMEEELYDKAFTGAYSTGFPEFRNMVTKNYNPDVVAEKTGIERHLIIELARHFASAGTSSLAICGRGKGQTAGSMMEFMAVHSLNALVGKINTPGGVWSVEHPDYIPWAKEMNVRAAIAGKKRIDEAGSPVYPDSLSLLNRLPSKILESKESPIEMLFVSNANPAYTLAGTDKVIEALGKIPFIVSFSSYMDETADQADLILPNHIYLERYQDVPVRGGLARPVIGLTRPVVEPQYDTMHSGDVVLKLAKGLGGQVGEGFPWDDYKDCLEKTMADRWKELEETGFWTDEAYQPKPWAGAFGGTYGKFAFSDTILPLPDLEGDVKDYPLILIPKESMRISSSHIGDTPFTVKTVPDTELKGKTLVIEINPRTGKEQGLADGKDAVLKTPLGQVRVKVSFFEGIMPGLMAMPKGLGHTAYGKYLKGKGASYNALVGPMEDPVSGQDISWGIRARISRV
ncbi:MAG: molybdopterin-dependent oxidoreductase [Proteobacteria bacterium]|nr:molybdopterin-dependent oxidoreductase [Pseudomonadota bacterium]